MENFFQWRQEWVLDLKQIDEQHRMLVEAVNKLSPLYLQLTKNPTVDNATREQLTGQLKLLYSDLEQHFRDEEKLMHEAAYPHYRNHAHTHVMLLAELKNYCNRITNRDEELDMGTLYSLRTWFVTHMLDDREFAAHFHASRDMDRYGPGEAGS
ncbi:MAG: hemerythrin family protein [Gammaproteobacteria bacterium]